jgi:formylglycine-generating enzyme required for sulfatase activity
MGIFALCVSTALSDAKLNSVAMEMVKIPAGSFGGKSCKTVTRICSNEAFTSVNEAAGCKAEETSYETWGWGEKVALTGAFYLGKTAGTSRRYRRTQSLSV